MLHATCTLHVECPVTGRRADGQLDRHDRLVGMLLACQFHEGAGEGKRVVRIHHADGKHAPADGTHRRIVVLDAKDGEVHELDGEGSLVVMKDGADGKQVIVKRTVTKDDGAQ